MNKIELILNYIFQNLAEVVVVVAILTVAILRYSQQVSENTFTVVTIFGFALMLVRWIVASYLNFMLTVRANRLFEDNRSVHFLNFDALKFMLISISLIGVIYLGINKVLNNETIATLLGGLIGSLLTMKGSFNDLKFTREERADLNRLTNPPTVSSTSSPPPSP